ncbi:uncharacterized protein HMPREF1541_03528 [Cyphellophora europaea CBS 101466]|uniref:Sas10 C-terminal domain-containing protein n=1 Tax=Cyphellophora europaea (strain CBS 101466) TaxID=1220924 RepID=W2RYR4_CYPE1|nr:uncharacterized protein HMPREF1541_03528 [Cyphellophora europaea CBS 101466]ETN41592.1 hypothetical protein HMPREF1541_03528 [Cyphellophora europaea CBS 101466]
MAKKRTRARADAAPARAANETFDNSEDEFIKGRDQILFDEGPAAKRRRKLEEEDAELLPSDEEVFKDNLPSDEEEEQDVDGASEDGRPAVADEDDEDEQYWGENRADYYNADELETEQDALDEEAEARRLQQKQLQEMEEADFGFDELAWTQADDESRRPTVEKLPPVQIPENATDEERWTILKTRYPEFKPLAEDLVSSYPIYVALKAEVEEMKKSKSRKLSINETRLRALAAYLASISMYMAVLSSSKDGISLPPSELREHPIMASLLRSRQLWETTKDLDSDIEEEFDVENKDTNGKPIPNDSSSANEAVKVLKKAQPRAVNPVAMIFGQDMVPEKSLKKSKSKPLVVDDSPTKTSKKSKAKAEKPKGATIEDLLSQSAPVDDETSDFGDEAPLTAEEAAEKALKKKSLRFYTSQIAQKAGKRAAASRHAGGDDDLPYKERIRDRQERIQREAEQRNQRHLAEDDALSDEYDENDLAAKMNDDANEYYNTLVATGQQKKADKRLRADAHATAAAQGAQVYEEATVGPDGKRRITYAIEKNKGLAPKRKKEVRNPRVKKKKKFEEKKKKLASMRPVWKGGEGKGGYKGELTGIKSNVVKSVKL